MARSVGVARDNLAIVLEMVVTHTELLGSTILKSLLVIKNKLISICVIKRDQCYFCFAHNNSLEDC